MEPAKSISGPVDPGLQQALAKLREFSGSPAEFWASYVESMCRLTAAKSGEVQTRQGGGEWKVIARHPRHIPPPSLPANGWRDHALEKGSVVVEKDDGSVVVIDVTPPDSTSSVIGLFEVAQGSSAAEAARSNAEWGRDVPAAFLARRRLERAEESAGIFAAALDLLGVVNAKSRYLEVAMALCNEVAARFNSERVSLGWEVNGEVKLQAISHTERIEKKMQAVVELEEVMEEVIDQDADIVIPAPAGEGTISRCHASYAEKEGGIHMASVCMRRGDEPVGVLTLERSTVEFDVGEQRSLRVLADQMVTRLGELKKHDRWFGARAWSGCRENAAKLVGVEKTGWKLIGLIITIALGVLVFGGSVYRVEAPFVLRSDSLAQLPAAFDGYIERVHFHIGDSVEAGQALVDIDRRELLLEETSALAELRRHRSESRRAQAEGELAEMRGSQALADQAEAKLQSVRYRLEQSRIEAPFDGVVVEGDLRERIGSPVGQGEILLKIARLSPMFVEGKVPEDSIHLIDAGEAGQIAFASRPDEKFAVEVERIEPLAVPEEAGNIFIVRCGIEGETPDWWRPGMSGLCKIETERRSYLWMFTRRTVDFLRMKFWW